MTDLYDRVLARYIWRACRNILEFEKWLISATTHSTVKRTGVIVPGGLALPSDFNRDVCLYGAEILVVG